MFLTVIPGILCQSLNDSDMSIPLVQFDIESVFECRVSSDYIHHVGIHCSPVEVRLQ